MHIPAMQELYKDRVRITSDLDTFCVLGTVQDVENNSEDLHGAKRAGSAVTKGWTRCYEA